MSDSEDSTVTYTAVSSPFGGMSDIGSPGVDGTPVMPEDPYAYVVAAFQAPPSPDYVPGPEEPEQTPLLLEFVPGHVYPKFMTLEDEVLPGKEQPLSAAVLPTTDSPGYIPQSDPKEDPVDYPADGGDDDDDDDESSDDDEDDDEDVEEDEEEEEEEKHPAPADSIPPPVHCVTTKMSIRDEPPTPFWSKTEIPSLPLLVSSPVPVSPPPLPASPTYPLGYRAAMIWQKAEYEVGESLSAPATRPTRGFRADYGFVATLGREDRLFHEAWGRSMDASDTAHSEVRALRTTILAYQTEIAALRAADHARQAQLVEILRLMSTLETHVTTLQG
ncbi:hypothetical protein Tco_0987665 [Tanacetum coccineum]